jgi:hypothetical protein
MANTIKVRATLHPVPRAEASKRFIKPGDEAVDVPRNAYYLRRIADKELEEVADAPSSPPPPSSPTVPVAPTPIAKEVK